MLSRMLNKKLKYDAQKGYYHDDNLIVTVDCKEINIINCGINVIPNNLYRGCMENGADCCGDSDSDSIYYNPEPQNNNNNNNEKDSKKEKSNGNA